MRSRGHSARESLAVYAVKTLLTYSLFAGMLAFMAGVPSVAPAPTPSPAKAFGAPVASVATSAAAATTATASADDARLANEVLDRLRLKYRYLDGVTVRMAPTPKGEEAVAYYTLDQIIISPTHSVTIEKILAHEVWHIIDWHDNGRFDWGENLPPTDPSQYSRKL